MFIFNDGMCHSLRCEKADSILLCLNNFPRQLWFRVNELLPVELQNDLPVSSMSASTAGTRSSPSGLQDDGKNILIIC